MMREIPFNNWMNRKAAKIGALLLALLVGFTAGFWTGHPSVKTFLGHDVKHESIVIGVKEDQPGTGYVQDYKSDGFDISLAIRMAKDNNFKVTFAGIPSQTRSTALTNFDANHVDLVIATFSITQPRVDSGLWFAGPYAVTRQGFMVKKGSPIHTQQDLKNAVEPVCTWGGTTSEQALYDAGLTNVDVEDDASTCVAKLHDGTVSAMSTDQLILYGFTQKFQDLEVLPNIKIGPSQYYGIAMAKQDNGEPTLQDCKTIENWLKNVYLNQDWDRDFSSNLQNAQVGDAEQYKPTAPEIDHESCTRNVN